MEILITYEEAKKRYPKQVAEALRKLATSSSKERGSAPESLTYSISWGVAVQGFTFSEMIGHVKKRIDEQDEEEVKPTKPTIAGLKKELDISWALHVRKGRWWASVPSGHPIPDEIYQAHLEWAMEDYEKRLRIANMTPEERQKSIAETINTLRGSHFLKLHIGRTL